MSVEIGGAPVGPRTEPLRTRAIETRAIVRGFVHSATIDDVGPNGVALRSDDRVATQLTRWGGEPPRAGGPPTVGSVRVDLVADDVVRVRYSPASCAIGGDSSPMLTGACNGPGATSVERDGDRVALTTTALVAEVELEPVCLRITDPGGRVVSRIGGRERNEWGLWDTLNTGVSHTVAGEHPIATETFSLAPGDAVYGFGEQFLGLDKVGQTIDLDMVEATGTTTPRSYKNIPFFWSTAGYGVFLHTSARVTCWIGSRGAADIQVAIDDDHLDYFVFVGDPKTILDRYTTLTGKAHVPPRWSFGWWQSKISYHSADEVLEVVRAQRAADLPIDVVHLDTHWFRDDWRCDLEFDPVRFPDPRAFMTDLREMGVHTCLWQLPYIPEGSALYDEIAAVGGFVRTETGETYDVGLCYTPGWKGTVGCIDMTNPEALVVWQRRLRDLHELGASAIKVDFGEQAPIDGLYHDGTPGSRAHNLYPLLYNRAVAEATHDATGEWISWARSAWAGSQRYPLHWGGDSSPNWENLGPQLAGGLSLGLSGFTFWSQDIGGFLGRTGGDLLIRWLQAGLFLSHARIHGVGTRELASFGGEVLRVGSEYLHLRYRLLPYLVGEARRSAAAGLPLARALVVEFPDDPSTWRIADQWLLGEHLLVAPILDPSNRRRVYLPPGRWADWWTGDVVDGARWLHVEAPIDRLPLWIRDGGVIGLGPVMLHVGERPTDTLTLRTVAPADGRATTGRLDVDGAPLAWQWTDGQLRVDDTTASVTIEEHT